jgi:hypothetical protein
MNGTEGSLIRAIRGPITLITVGVLFALNNFTPYQFRQTWPVLLIVFGLLSLLRRGTAPAPVPYPYQAPYPQPSGQYPFPPPNAPGVPNAGSYRQSQYNDPSAAPSAAPAPAKGGFGGSASTNAPPRSEDPDQNPGGAQ